MSERVVLSVEDLHVGYRLKIPSRRGKVWARAVDGVGLVVKAGETLALVGESGSGKTSVANAVMRLVQPTSGRIVFEGVDLVPLRGAQLRAMRPKFQMIFQDPFESLDPRRTVLDTVMEPLEINGIGASRAERQRLALEALREAGITPPESVGARYTHQLSGGQRQRVAIAAAMILRPVLVVADEPVSMLDVSMRAGVLSVMAEMRDRRGAGFLFITHDLSLAWTFADRIAVMFLGRIVEEGTSDEVITRPMHPYTQALVSVIPVPDTTISTERIVLRGETPNPTAIPSGCRFHPRCPRYLALGEPSQCREEDPALEMVGGRRVACHFIEQTT